MPYLPTPLQLCGRLIGLLVLLWLGWSIPAGAQAIVEQPHVVAELVSEADTIVPGRPWLVAVRLTSDPHWHTYWRNPGDAGSSAAVTWKLPAGYTAGPLGYPAPRRVTTINPPSAVYAYEGEVLLLTQITPPASARPGESVTITANASWVVCENECIPGDAKLSLVVPVAKTAASVNTKWGQRLRTEYARIPRPRPEWGVATVGTGSGYTMRITPPPGWARALAEIQFFPDSGAVIDHAAAQTLTRSGDVYELALKKSTYAMKPTERLRGLLVSPSGWDTTGTITAIEVDTSVR